MRLFDVAVTARDTAGNTTTTTTPVVEHGPIVGGYYLGGLRDITDNTIVRGLNVAGHTTYRSIAQGSAAFPGAAWLDTLARARGLRTNFVLELKVYGAAPPADAPTPDGVMNFHPAGTRFYSWRQVLDGRLDPLLRRCANAARALPYPINIQFCSERDTDHQSGGTIAGVPYSFTELDALGVSGIAYMVALFRAVGVTNATFSAGIGGWHRGCFLRSYVPDVDVIQFNAYNHGGARPAADVFGRTYAWLADLPAGSQTKPVHLAEWGCDAALGQPAWIRTVPAALRQLPRVRFAAYFDSGWGALGAGGLDALTDCYNDRTFY